MAILPSGKVEFKLKTQKDKKANYVITKGHYSWRV